MLVSVVTLIHDENISHVKKCIFSILNQDYKNFEYIIVDDSQKKIFFNFFHKLKKNEKRIKYFKLNNNLDLPSARNFALLKTKGQIIFLQDSDDWSNKNRISCQLSHIQKNKIDLSSTLTTYFDSKSRQILKSKKLKDNKRIRSRDILFNNFVSIGSVAFKRKILKNNELFRKELKFCDDMDFVLRFSSKYKFYQLNKYLYNYRFNSNSSTINTKNNYQPYLDYFLLKKNNGKIKTSNIMSEKKKIVNNYSNLIYSKNTLQQISYSVYSGNYYNTLKKINGFKLKIYCILIIFKVIANKLIFK